MQQLLTRLNPGSPGALNRVELDSHPVLFLTRVPECI